MNLLLVVLWAFAVPYSRFCHMASCLSTIWACIIIVCKMLYHNTLRLHSHRCICLLYSDMLSGRMERRNLM